MIKKGALSVRVAATHGVFSGDAIQNLKQSIIQEIVVTNTINMPKEKYFDKITVLSIASLIGEAIQRIHEEKSVSSLFL